MACAESLAMNKQVDVQIITIFCISLIKSYLPITDDLCGIFVKSITEGSAASMNGQIQVNDQIIEVIIDRYIL